MNHWAFWAGTILVLITLWEVFETMILPRAIMRPGRMTHVFYRATHSLKRTVAGRVPGRRFRETLLSIYGPLSLLMLIVLWVSLLILGFALVHYGLNTHFKETEEAIDLENLLYFSGTTFFTLGYGDLTPAGSLARSLAVLESGLGFGMLAAVMGYLPVLYQAFSEREAAIVQLANRCGGAIDGVGLVLRYTQRGNEEGLILALEDLERWISELLEMTVSYPMLAFYRSQRADRSWIGGLTAVLDATTILQLPTRKPWSPRLVDQAELTFSMAHHAAQALIHILHQNPSGGAPRPFDRKALADRLARSGIELEDGAAERFDDLNRRYEVEVGCLADFLNLQLPDWPGSGEPPA